MQRTSGAKDRNYSVYAHELFNPPKGAKIRNMNPAPRTNQQRRIADGIASSYGIPSEDVYFLNSKKPDEPWLPARALMTIARKSPQVLMIEDRFDRFDAGLNQIIHSATVSLKEGPVITRVGAATIGEVLPNDEEADEHELAAGRALHKALTAAGINPVREGAVKPFKPVAHCDDSPHNTDDPGTRDNDLKRIHSLAEEAGLISYPDGHRQVRDYRNWMAQHFGVTTVAGMSQAERASVVEKLKAYSVEREL
jgi:hypothetical protein